MGDIDDRDLLENHLNTSQKHCGDAGTGGSCQRVFRLYGVELAPPTTTFQPAFPAQDSTALHATSKKTLTSLVLDENSEA